MSEMLKRVAFILLDRGIDAPDHEIIAREILEAMREPTRTMLDAAATVDRYAQPGEEWEPMIDAALSKVDA